MYEGGEKNPPKAYAFGGRRPLTKYHTKIMMQNGDTKIEIRRTGFAGSRRKFFGGSMIREKNFLPCRFSGRERSEQENLNTQPNEIYFIWLTEH